MTTALPSVDGDLNNQIRIFENNIQDYMAYINNIHKEFYTAYDPDPMYNQTSVLDTRYPTLSERRIVSDETELATQVCNIIIFIASLCENVVYGNVPTELSRFLNVLRVLRNCRLHNHKVSYDFVWSHPNDAEEPFYSLIHIILESTQKHNGKITTATLKFNPTDLCLFKLLVKYITNDISLDKFDVKLLDSIEFDLADK